MIKYIISDYGDGAPPIQKITSSFEKTAYVMDDEIKHFIEKNIKPSKDDKKHMYLWTHALSAGETYGPNSRGDYFPREELLKHHKTFETNPASAFQNHANKDPNIRLGQVLFSYFNKDTDRVEVLERIDWERVAKYGQDWLKNLLYFLRDGRMDQTINVSMGTKIEGDYCSICGKFARNDSERCKHLPAMNGQWIDGKRCYMINKRPNFFDISFVRRGADRTARVFQKVASMEEYDNPGTIMYDDELAKILDKSKQVTPDKPIKKRIQKKADLPTFSKDFLNALSEYELPEILGTLKVAGCEFKPEEYQYIALKKLGEDALANNLWEEGKCFSPIELKPEACIEEKVNENLLDKIAYIIPDRSEYKGFSIMRAASGEKLAADYELETWDSELTPILRQGYYNHLATDIEKTAGIGTFLTMLLMMLPELSNIKRQMKTVRQTESANIHAIEKESPSYQIPHLGQTNVVNPIPVMISNAPMMQMGGSGIYNPLIKNPFIDKSMKLAGWKMDLGIPLAAAAATTAYGVGRDRQKEEDGDPTVGKGLTGTIAKHPVLSALGAGALAVGGIRGTKKLMKKISSDEILDVSKEDLNMYKNFLSNLSGENLINILDNIPDNIANTIVKL